MACELPGLTGATAEPVDGVRWCSGCRVVSDVTDPELEAKLRRRLDWPVGFA